MPDRREAIIEDLKAVVDDLKSLLESAITDPKERQRKERKWRVLYGALGVLTTLAARRAAAKAWAVLTGEQPPIKQSAQAKSASDGGTTREVPPRRIASGRG